MTTTASGVAPQRLEPFDGLSRAHRGVLPGDQRSGEGYAGRDDSPDGLDQTSLTPASGRHHRHPHRHQTFPSKAPSFPHVPRSSTSRSPSLAPAVQAEPNGSPAGSSWTYPHSVNNAHSQALAGPSWPSWDNLSDLGEQNRPRPSLLPSITSPSKRDHSFNKHTPSYNSSPRSHPRSHSLSAPLSHSFLPDDSAVLPPTDFFPPPNLACHSEFASAPESRRSSSTRAPAPFFVDFFKNEKFLPLPPHPPSTSPTPAPGRLRSFRSRIAVPVNPFRGLTGTPGEAEATAFPQPLVATMVNGAREAALGTALRDGSDPTSTLEEYAWRSLIARVRVRDYCEGATFAICASSVNHVRVAITHTPTRLLFPYDLAADAPFGAHTPQIHPASVLNAITRKQVVDVIVRLVRERAPIEARVIEIMLEYIGHKWHSSEGDVDIVSRKLFEIESEVEANEPNRCAGAVATIQRLRFQLGLVSAAQLASRLNSLPAFIRDSTGFDANQLLHAWAVRRLNASQLPQFVTDALFNIRDMLNHAPHREAVGSVLRWFGLDGRRLSGKESPPRGRNRITSRSFQTSPRISPTKRRTMPFPHWFPRNSTRFNGGEERRPSLPTLLTPAEPANISWPIPMQGQEASPPRSSPDGSPYTTPTPTAGASQAASSQLALLDPYSVRIAVVDQILELRYRLGADADGWFLGTGQDKAAEIVNHFPRCEELRDTIVELRRIFQLPDPAVSNKLGLTIVPLSPRVDMLSVERPRVGLHVTTPSLDTVPVIHERDVSFDLDQYMADISHDDPDVSSSTLRADEELVKTEVMIANEEDIATPFESPGLLAGPGPGTRSSVSSEVSHFSFTSSSSALSGGRRGSTIFDFVICEAVRVAVDHGPPLQATQDPITIDTSQKAALRHSKSLSLLSDPDMYTRVPELRSRRSPHRNHVAMPSLSAPLGKIDFDLKSENEMVSAASQESNSVPLISPTPKTTSPGVDFSISPVISPVTSPMVTARPSKEFKTVISRPPSPPPDVESASARERSYQRLSTSPIDRAGSRTPTVASPEGRSRRHRQMVIVDGEPISPGSTKTPLGMVLTLFSQRKNLTPDAVEEILGQAVQVEEERMTAQDEEFDAEARVRLAWLLEQVANELSQPELIAAVQRVLGRLSNKEIPVRRPSSSTSYSSRSSPSSSRFRFAVDEAVAGSARCGRSQHLPYLHRSTVPPSPSSFGSRMYGRRDLTITVPPRALSTIQVTSSPPSSPSVESASWTYTPSPEMTTSDSSSSLYSSGSLYSTTMSTAVSIGFNMTASSEESFSTSPVSLRGPPSGKPLMIRFPNYARGMGTPLQRQKSGATYSALSGKQRMSLASSPNPSPLMPCIPDQISGSFESLESARGIHRSPLGPQPPKVSPPIPLTDVHAREMSVHPTSIPPLPACKAQR